MSGKSPQLLCIFSTQTPNILVSKEISLSLSERQKFLKAAAIYKEKLSLSPLDSSPNLEKNCNLKLSLTTINVNSLKATDLGDVSCPI